MPETERLEIYDAITDYAFFQKEPVKLSSIQVQLVWMMALPILKQSWTKTMNGRKGGGQIGNANAKKRAKNELKTSNPIPQTSYPKAKVEQTTSNKDKNNDNDNENNNESDKERATKAAPKRETKRFTKPTLEEIKVFISENSFSIDAEDFFDFYESKGWKVGNAPMKDWKATVRRWQRKEQQRPPKATAAPSTPQQQRSIFEPPKEEEERGYYERF